MYNIYVYIHLCTCRILLGDCWNVVGFPQLKNKREIAYACTHTYTQKIFKG